MKNKLSFLAFAGIIIMSHCGCSKSDSLPFTSYLKGTIDGVAFDCNASISANKPEALPGRSDPTIRISGQSPMYSIKLFILAEAASIAPGTYAFQADKNRNATVSQNSNIYYAGNGGAFDPTPLYGSGRIIIAEIDKNYIKGSFEFVTAVTFVTATSKTVTGEFYIQRN